MAPLPLHLTSLFDEHQHQDARGLRREALDTLDRFIAGMLEQSDEARDSWATTFCERTAAVDAEVQKVRFPLFRELLFPMLLRRSTADDAEAYYWLACFSQHLYRNRALWAQLDWADEIGLLERSVALNPTHGPARYKLVAALADAFDYCVHEVPSGVLGFNSANGSSVEQCDELLVRLASFERLVGSLGMETEYAERVAAWRFYFESYRRYGIDPEGTSSYAEFLELHPVTGFVHGKG